MLAPYEHTLEGVQDYLWYRMIFGGFDVLLDMSA